jgi:hypothetical protein
MWERHGGVVHSDTSVLPERMPTNRTPGGPGGPMPPRPRRSALRREYLDRPMTSQVVVVQVLPDSAATGCWKRVTSLARTEIRSAAGRSW